MAVRFSAGLISNDQAAELNRLGPIVDALSDFASRLMIPKRDDFSARLTAIEDETLRTAWTELESDRFGQLVEKTTANGGRTGTFTASPAFPMSGSGPSTFPVDVRLRQRLSAVDDDDATSLGTVYEYDPPIGSGGIEWIQPIGPYSDATFPLGGSTGIIGQEVYQPGRYVLFLKVAGVFGPGTNAYAGVLGSATLLLGSGTLVLAQAPVSAGIPYFVGQTVFLTATELTILSAFTVGYLIAVTECTVGLSLVTGPGGVSVGGHALGDQCYIAALRIGDALPLFG